MFVLHQWNDDPATKCIIIKVTEMIYKTGVTKDYTLKCQIINSSCFTALHVLMNSIIDIFDRNFPGQETNIFSIRGSRAPLRYIVSVKFILENVSNLYIISMTINSIYRNDILTRLARRSFPEI